MVMKLLLLRVKSGAGINKIKKFKHIVTLSGGSNAVHQTDFTALRNKKIILWPDNDEEGFKSMACGKNIN